MSFKIISCGWMCEQFLEQTLASVEEQEDQDWEIMVVYDGGDNGADRIRSWCDSRDERWRYRINDEQLWAVRNQREGIGLLEPDDDDIIIFLDLDGDRLAHPWVLTNLREYYKDDTLVTYGNYTPIPFASTCPLAIPFPEYVIQNRSYRQYIRSNNNCCFNHLRTMKGKVWKALPEENFHREDGSWYHSGTDYVTIVPALEMADGRYKCVEEVLLLYNNANPHADYIEHPAETTGNILDFLLRPPMEPLPRS